MLGDAHFPPWHEFSTSAEHCPQSTSAEIKSSPLSVYITLPPAAFLQWDARGVAIFRGRAAISGFILFPPSNFY